MKVRARAFGAASLHIFFIFAVVVLRGFHAHGAAPRGRGIPPSHPNQACLCALGRTTRGLNAAFTVWFQLVTAHHFPSADLPPLSVLF